MSFLLLLHGCSFTTITGEATEKPVFETISQRRVSESVLRLLIVPYLYNIIISFKVSAIHYSPSFDSDPKSAGSHWIIYTC